MASAYLKKTNPTANTDSRKKGTFSFWLKRSRLGLTQYLYTEYSDGSNNGVIYISSADTFHAISYDGGVTRTRLSTNRVFKDTSAWYHIVFAYDSTLATADDRQKLWVNGEQITSFASRTNPAQNGNFWFGVGGSNYPIEVGAVEGQSPWDGYLAHFHRVDSQALDVSVFGEYDSTTGIWKPKTNPSITYTGTSDYNFFLDFADSSNMGNDVSGNNNDLTVTGTITQTIDTPSNVFATLNPLSTSPITGTNGYFSNGNTVYDAPESSPYDIATGSTLGVSKGKWYWEVKWVIDGGGSTQAAGLGIYESDQPIDLFGNMRGASGYKNVIWDTRHDLYVNGSDTGDNYTAASGDILGLALDLDNGTLKIHKNGTYFNSGNAVTTAIDTSKTYLILASPNGGSGNHSTLSFNFGNGYFGTTAVASAGTNAGIGTFEYDVPSGYKAICTKNINAQEYS